MHPALHPRNFSKLPANLRTCARAAIQGSQPDRDFLFRRLSIPRLVSEEHRLLLLPLMYRDLDTQDIDGIRAQLHVGVATEPARLAIRARIKRVLDVGQAFTIIDDIWTLGPKAAWDEVCIAAFAWIKRIQDLDLPSLKHTTRTSANGVPPSLFWTLSPQLSNRYLTAFYSSSQAPRPQKPALNSLAAVFSTGDLIGDASLQLCTP
ncbi:hypothetical protein MKEN_00303000 [Mycena kentingensis (nom. inval.)]|nr:hypothetical protein MKEN_00303000 [Mycena kentingensis (nom. inval.)]